MLEKILEEIEEATRQEDAPIYCGNMEVDGYVRMSRVEDIIRKHMNDGKDANVPTNDGWISVEERLPDTKRANYEVTFINECGYEEHGFAQWYDGDFHIPAVVIAWREHLEPYRPKKGE